MFYHFGKGLVRSHPAPSVLPGRTSALVHPAAVSRRQAAFRLQNGNPVVLWKHHNRICPTRFSCFSISRSTHSISDP